MTSALLTLLLASDGGAPISQPIELGCDAARRIVLGTKWNPLAKGKPEVPVLLSVTRLGRGPEQARVKAGCDLEGRRIVADVELEPDVLGLLVSAVEQPDGSWRVVRLQNAIRPASRALVGSSIDRDRIRELDLSK